MWLLSTAKILGAEPDAGLKAFLDWEARFLPGFDPGASVPDPDPELSGKGISLYGPDLWNAETLRVPARLRATRTHLDLHFRLASVRVDVRRAGLDVDPGWVPWLGRVVRFHYGSGAEPPAGWRGA
jgi:hypothetical protein